MCIGEQTGNGVNRITEIPRLAECKDLVGDVPMVIVIPIELERIESESEPSLGRVTGDTLAPSRVMPDLRACCATVTDHEGLVQPCFRHEKSVGLGVVPAIG